MENYVRSALNSGGPRRRAVGLLAGILASTTPAPAEAAQQDASYQEAAAPASPFLFKAGPSASVLVPRAERLVYKVGVNLTVWESNAGTVTQTCTVKEQAVPLMLADAFPHGGEAASIKLEAD